MEEEKLIKEFETEKKNMRIRFILITILVALIAAVAASEFTLFYYYGGMSLEKDEVSQDASLNIEAIANSLKNFREVIDEYFIGDIDEQKLMDETIKNKIYNNKSNSCSNCSYSFVRIYINLL